MSATPEEVDDVREKMTRWIKESQNLTDKYEAAVLEAEHAKRAYLRLLRHMHTEERNLINAELQLDSFIQEKEKNFRKVAVAIAEVRAVRNKRINRGFGWQYTLTNPKIPDEETAKRWFGYAHRSKTWSYPSAGVSPNQVIEPTPASTEGRREPK